MFKNSKESQKHSGDSDFLRCDWCGIPVSNNWILLKRTRYCSKECQNASSELSPETYSMAKNCVLTGLILLFLLFLPFDFSLTNFLIAIFVFAIISRTIIFFFNAAIQNATLLKQKVPKNSKRHDIILVKRMDTVAKCPNCDGNLDITSPASDKVIECEYCGAMGVLKVV